MDRFAFFCTRPAGWTGEDYGLLLAGLAAFTLVYLISRWLLGKFESSKFIRAIIWVITIIGYIIAALYIAYIIWIGSC